MRKDGLAKVGDKEKAERHDNITTPESIIDIQINGKDNYEIT